jgi:histidinol-phosphatase (PHP family)
VELGQILHDMEAAKKVNADKRVDFIIGSVHQIAGEPDFYFVEYDKMTMDDIYDLLERYFSEAYDLSRTELFDVFGHITYCLRYMKQRHGINADISRFDDIIEETFRNLAMNGKGIEINTSGLRQGFGDCFPNLKYIKLFHDIGGEIITIGSDSHTVEDIAANSADGIKLAKEAGFRRLAYFKKRKPHFIDIE